MACREAKRKIINFRLFPISLCVFLAALTVGTYSETLVGFVAGILSVICFTLLMVFCKKYRRRVIILSLVFLVGLTSVSVSKLVYKNRKTIEGEIVCKVLSVNKNNVTVFQMEVDGKRVYGRALFSKDEKLYLEEGSVLVFPDGTLDPKSLGTETYQIIDYSDSVKYGLAYDTVTVTGTSRTLSQKVLYGMKKALCSSLEEREADMAYAMLFGYSEIMSNDARYVYSAAGISHLFAVSGLHVGILSGIIFFLLRKFKVRYAVRPFIMLTVLLFYAYLCDFSPSVLRTSVMVLIISVSESLHRRFDIASAVSVSAMSILLIKPYYLFSASFIMSYSAILGILLFNGFFVKLFRFFPPFLKETIASTFSVNMVMIPIILLIFGIFTPYFVVANLLILPLMPVLYVLLLFGTVVCAVIPSAWALLLPPGAMLSLLDKLCTFISDLKLSVVPCGNLSVLLAGLIFLLSLVCTRKLMISKKVKIALFSILLVVNTVTCVGIVENSLIKENAFYAKQYEYGVVLNIDGKNHYVNFTEKEEEKVLSQMDYLKTFSSSGFSRSFSVVETDLTEVVSQNKVYIDDAVLWTYEGVLYLRYDEQLLVFDPYGKLQGFVLAQVIDGESIPETDVKVLTKKERMPFLTENGKVDLYDVKENFTISFQDGIIVKKQKFLGIF